MEDKLKQIISAVKNTAVAAGQTVSHAAEVTGKRAEQILEQTKLNLRIIDLENETNDLFREIGKLVVASRADETFQTGDIEEKIQQIDAKRLEITEINEKLDLLKRSKKCPNPDCGKRCAKEDKFCNACGAVLED